MNTKVAIGVGVGALVLIGGGVFLYSQRKKAEEGLTATDEGTDEGTDMQTKMASTSDGAMDSTGAPVRADDSSVASLPVSKKDTIANYKADKARIKSICGRRRLLGKKKREWLACVNAQGGNSSDSFYSMSGVDQVEVGDILTDL